MIPLLRIFMLCLPAMLSASAWAGSDEDLIRRRLEDWAAAFNARDAVAACDLFAPDLSYSLPELSGGTHATMCENLAKSLGRPNVSFSYAPPDIHEIIVSGDLAVVRLTWTLTVEADGEKETSREEGIDIFRRQPDGRWSIARFIAFTPQERH